MSAQQFQVRKDDLSKNRLVYTGTPEPGEGELLVAVERFALTANNVTYGVAGERIGYWHFFIPADNDDGGWGIIPVWGFGAVTVSNVEGIEPGERIYGYFPMATHLIMKPARIGAQHFTDGIDHRQALPPVYNSYVRVSEEANYDSSMDDERMLLHPLYATSFCLHDFFLDNDWFGARQIIITSASSKTSIGTAYALADDADAPPAIGLTSAGNRQAVEALGLYDRVVTYDELSSIDADTPSAIIDMSGSGPVLARLHRHLGDNMRYTSNVGLTHWSDNAMQDGFIRERSAMFFAPGHIQKRGKEWGPEVFGEKAREFWRSAAVRSRDWLTIDQYSGLEETQRVFEDLRTGGIAPNCGICVIL